MPEPLYRRIADDLLQKIESGELGHGAQLPTELELREHYQASRNTVRDAVRWLITRGMIETRPGQGTFVVEKIDPFVTNLNVVTGFDSGEGAAYASEVTASRRKPDTSQPRVEIQQAAGVIASELGLAAGETVVSRHQQRYIDGTPWSLQTTFYPIKFVQQGAGQLLQAQDMPGGTIPYLEEVLGVREVGWHNKITVRAPDSIETGFFRLPDDGRVAVFEAFQTGFDELGRRLRLTVIVYPADRNEFVLDAGEVPPPAGTESGTHRGDRTAGGSAARAAHGAAAPPEMTKSRPR